MQVGLSDMTIWSRWVRSPQKIWLRRAVFQIHLWCGVGLGIYIFVIGLTGSVLVYRTELYTVFSPAPVVVDGSGEAMTVDELSLAAHLGYPGYEVAEVRSGEAANHAVEISLRQNGETKRRLFDPFTGEDLGHPLPFGYRATAWLLDLHDNLLGGTTGRRINGIGALILMVLSLTGAIIWWPGIPRWRRSLTVDVRADWPRLNWRLHSTLGFLCWPFIFMWGITGTYLSFPNFFSAIVDYIEPFDMTNPVERVGDRVLYWLAYLHFGRLGGRGIPWCDRGLCNSTTMAIWAFIGLVPPVLSVTGGLMWWNRVLRRRRASDTTA